MNFVSLNIIINDLLSIIRGAKVNQSEPISRIQLENWIHQYRSLLLKQDLDKGKMPNPDYIQTIPCIQLEKVGYNRDGSTHETDEELYRTNIQIPKTIDLNFKSGFMFIGTVDGQEIQYVPSNRVKWQLYKKFTNREPVAYLENGYIYVQNANAITYLKIKGVFEVPTELVELVNPMTATAVYSYDDKYPMPINMIPTLKEMILKNELNIESKDLGDDKNDSNFKTDRE